MDLRLMPSGGAGSLDSLISLYLGWARNFIVLLDSDSEGLKQKRRYSQKFGPVMDDRLFTLHDLHGDFAGQSKERGFEGADRDAIQGIAYPGQKYRKDNFWRSLQEAVATRTSVAVGAPTKTRFSELLTALAEKLAAV